MRLFDTSAVVLSVVLGAACSSIPKDPEMPATDGFDATVKLAGCGNIEPYYGYVFCRVSEDAPATQYITIHAPSTDCSRTVCATYQIYHLDGSPGLAGGLERSRPRADIPFSQIIGHGDPIGLKDDGEYLVIMVVYYNMEGVEHSMTGRGFIRLNVTRKGYKGSGCDSPHRAWANKLYRWEMQTTTGYRTAICELD